MSDEVRIDIAGDRQAGLRFEDFPDHLHDDLRSEIDALSHELLSRIEAVIPENTGTLRSQARLRMFDQEDRIRGYIDIEGRKGKSDHAKAGALEYGSRGKPIKVRKRAATKGGFWDRLINGPQARLESFYYRTPNIAEHSFMRGPLEAMRPEILQRLTGVVERAVADAND